MSRLCLTFFESSVSAMMSPKSPIRRVTLSLPGPVRTNSAFSKWAPKRVLWNSSIAIHRYLRSECSEKSKSIAPWSSLISPRRGKWWQESSKMSKRSKSMSWVRVQTRPFSADASPGSACSRSSALEVWKTRESRTWALMCSTRRRRLSCNESKSLRRRASARSHLR